MYFWADGIYSTLRREDDRLSLLVIIGVNEPGEKPLLALADGYRETKADTLTGKTAPSISLISISATTTPKAGIAGYSSEVISKFLLRVKAIFDKI